MNTLETEGQMIQRVMPSLMGLKNILVLNDEAHHTHEEGSEWNNIIRQLQKTVPKGLAAQLDFTATPRHTKGQLFSWTVFDYPLKQAIIDNVVKRPLKGIAKDIDDDKQRIEELYLVTLGRLPNEAEQQACMKYLKEAPSPERGLQDVLWSLLNTREFLLNH